MTTLVSFLLQRKHGARAKKKEMPHYEASLMGKSNSLNIALRKVFMLLKLLPCYSLDVGLHFGRLGASEPQTIAIEA